jgi:uncharacterized delta-60 repeat protein
MRRLGVVVMLAAGCGSVSTKNDAGVDTVAPGGATIALEKTTSWVAQGGTTSIGFTITRGTAQNGALTVHVANLPTGVTAPDVDVAAGATAGMVSFSATTASTVGTTTSVDVTLSNASMQLDQHPFDVFVAGAPGTVDTTYGSNGTVSIPLPDPLNPSATGDSLVRAIAQYPASAGANAGKLVAAIQLETTGTPTSSKKIAIVRLNTDGTLDQTFNTFGYMTLSGTGDRFIPQGVAIDSQGRIVVSASHFTTGSTACNTYVARVTASGALDSGFTIWDSNPFNLCGYNLAVATIAGDKVVAMGFWNASDGSQRVTLTQLKADGSPDVGVFGSAAAVLMPNPGAKTVFRAIRLFVDGQGNYVVVGSYCNGNSSSNSYTACDSVIGRITPAGTWDTTFNTTGYASLTFGTSTGATLNYQGFASAAFDSAGNIITGGWSEDYTDITMARFTSAGANDAAFGTGGRVQSLLAPGSSSNELGDVAIDSTGRVVGMGYLVLGGSLAAATRYGTNGAIDSGFGTAGVGTATAAGLQTLGTIQLDGRILVVGAAPRSPSGANLAVWRFWP